MGFPNFQGRRRLWTKEYVLQQLAAAAAEIKGPLPRSDAEWARLKKGRFDWPPAVRVLEFFHSMPRAWMAAGVPSARVDLLYSYWIPDEDAYLLENAGILTLRQMGKALRRSDKSVHARLQRHGIRARDNQGLWSAAELCREYKCPYHRVREGLARGIIIGRLDKVRNCWRVDPEDLTPAAISFLQAPKQTYRSVPPDLADWDARRNLRRTKVNGVMTRVPGTPQVYQSPRGNRGQRRRPAGRGNTQG